MHCYACGKDYTTYKGFCSHITNHHQILVKEYYDKHVKKENEEICDICGNTLKFVNANIGYSKECTHERFKCKICGRDHLKTSKALLMHLVRDHSKVSHKEYYDSYLKKENEGFCKICNEPTIFENFTLGYRNCCCADCTREYNTGYRNNFQTPESIEKIKKTSIKTRNKNLRIFEKDNDLILISNLNLKYFKRIVEYKNL